MLILAAGFHRLHGGDGDLPGPDDVDAEDPVPVVGGHRVQVGVGDGGGGDPWRDGEPGPARRRPAELDAFHRGETAWLAGTG
jgi:hypothetical protein